MSPLLSDAFALAERAGGAPVYLYTFARGAVMWRYTSDGLALTVAATGMSYNAAKIDHDEIQRKDESGAVDIKVTLGGRLAVVAALRDGSTLPMYLAIHKYHPAAGGTPARFAYGNVGSPSLDSATASCELVLHTTDGAFDVDVPTALITVQCQKSTYSAECGLKWEDFAADAEVTTIGHRTITVDSVGAAPDGYYDSGMIRFGERELLYIERQVGTALTVFSEIPSALVATTAVQLLPGDDKNPSTCKTKFNNLSRFLGFPWLPAKNPLIVKDSGVQRVYTPWDEPTPVGYTTPAQFGRWHGNSIIGSSHVVTWEDVTGNGRNWNQATSIFQPDVASEGGTPADGHDTGLIIFGQHDIGDPSLPYIGSPALTFLNGPDLSALSATGAEIFINIRLAGLFESRADTGSDKYRGLWWMNGPGYGSTADVFPMADGTIRSTWGLAFANRYIMPPPAVDLTQECVYNIANGLDRWTARLNGKVLKTVASSYDGHSPSFQSGSQLGFSPGGGLLGTGDIDRWLYGVVRRMVIYAGTLNATDRALAQAWTATGVGTPP